MSTLVSIASNEINKAAILLSVSLLLAMSACKTAPCVSANKSATSNLDVPLPATWQYTTLTHFDMPDFEHDPSVLRLQRAGWCFVGFQESEAWVGGVDRPAGRYALFRREVPEEKGPIQNIRR
jgi:hypothetical protein